MQTPLMVIAAVVALGLVYVVLPVVVGVYDRFRDVRRPICPETHDTAIVQLDAVHAALTAAVGTPDLKVSHCSRWPEHRDCAQGCTAAAH